MRNGKRVAARNRNDGRCLVRNRYGKRGGGTVSRRVGSRIRHRVGAGRRRIRNYGRPIARHFHSCIYVIRSACFGCRADVALRNGKRAIARNCNDGRRLVGNFYGARDILHMHVRIRQRDAVGIYRICVHRLRSHHVFANYIGQVCIR